MLLLWTVLTVVVCSWTPALSAPTPGTVVTSAAEIDYPPFSVVDAQGRADGFSVELLQAALQAMGREVTFRTGPRAEVKGWLEKGDVDALPPSPAAVLRIVVMVAGPLLLVLAAIFAWSWSLRHKVANRTAELAHSEDQFRALRDNLPEGLVYQIDSGEDGLTRRFTFISAGVERLHEITTAEALANPRLLYDQVLEEDRDMVARLEKTAAEAMSPFRAEVRVVLPSGETRWRLFASAPRRLPDNHLVWDGIEIDITERKRAAESLRASEELLSLFIRHSPIYAFIKEVTPTESLVLVASENFQDMIGIPGSRMTGKTMHDLFPSDFADKITADDWDVVSKGEILRLDENLGDRHFTTIKFPIFLGDRRLLAGYTIDITERKRAEEKLRASEEQLRLLIENAPFAMAMFDREMRYMYVSPRWRQDYGLGDREMHGISHYQVFPELTETIKEHHRRGLSGETLRSEEDRFERANGTVQWVRWELRPWRDVAGEVGGILLFTEDITERKRAEEVLRERETFIRIVLDNLPVGVSVNSVLPHVSFEYMNDLFSRFYRTTRQELSDPDAFWEAIYEDPEFRETIKRRVLDDCASGDPLRMHWENVPIVRKDQETRYVSARNIPVPDKNLMISTVWDVTEQHLSELRIEHLNRVLRAIRDVNQLIVREKDRHLLIQSGCRLLVENRGYSSALIALTDENGRAAAWAASGLSAKQTLLTAMLDRGDLPPCFDRVRSVEGVQLINDRGQVCGLCPIAAECAGADSLVVRLAHGGASFGILAAALEKGLGADEEERSLFSEMSEDLAYALNSMRMAEAGEKSEQARQALESQFLQAQKMEAVGRLAGGVAHDFNNMLTVINGYAEMVLAACPVDHPQHPRIQEILNAGRQSATLVRQLLAFARKQTIAPQVLDLNETVAGMLKMLGRLIGEDIDLAWLPGHDLWSVKMDPAQIDQILANLAVNARDAIAGVGRVTIETDNAVIDQTYCSDHAECAPGEFVLLAVSDTGCGMDEKTRSRLFEPFFTTKEPGKGTGLGLATVYGIVRQNNGFINVYSEPGRGTTFKIYLPRHASEKARSVLPAAKTDVPLGTETVLVAEDKPAVLELTRTMLSSLGYAVISAESPAEALRLAGEHTGDIHLLLSDVIMPEMSGRDLWLKIRELRPGIKCLFMSGYTANVIAHHGVLDEGIQFIEKPFTRQALARKIRETLDGK